MTRLDHDEAMRATAAILDVFAHLLRPEDYARFFGAVFEAVKTCLLTRDELRARERKRLGKPAETNGD